MNYEIEIEDSLFDALQKKYGIKDRVLTYLYLKYRTYCLHKNYDFKNKLLLIQTLFDELSITEYQYKNETIHLYYSRENSLSNIIDNMEFELSKTVYEKIYDRNQILIDIKNTTEKELKKYRKDSYYEYYELYFSLNKLNEIFHIYKIEDTPKLEGFIQESNTINKEIECKRYIDFANFETDNIDSIQEKDLEDYLITHLEDIEPNLKYITRQFELNEGRIDILAIDKNEKYVIIELKTTIDKSLIWQCMYYPEELKRLYKTRNVRMITIAPEYPEYILGPLKKIKNIESYRYNISITNHKVEHLKLQKIS